MQTNTPAEASLIQRALQKREMAVAALLEKRPSFITTLIPVWFALLLALLVSFVPLRPNSIPIVVGVLVIAIAGLTGTMVRANRRLETAIQLILQDLRT